MEKLVKHLGVVSRKESLTREQFIFYWLNSHAPLVAKLPGLVRYTVNIVDRDRSPEFDHDGFAELWFRSQADMDAAFASPEASVLAADVARFVDRHLTVRCVEHTILG